MRYYEFRLALKVEDIRSEKVRLKDISYESPVDALTMYLFRNLTNGVTFLSYRVEEGCIKSIYAIDEKIRKPQEALDEIVGTLDDILVPSVTASEPYEITMLDFNDKLEEARRRGLLFHWGKIADQANLILYDDRDYFSSGRCHFRFDEKVARKDASALKADHLFDETLKQEIGRIRKDSGSLNADEEGSICAFPVNYAISARSKEAGSDIASTLMSELAASGRLSCGRMLMFTEITPELHNHGHYFEKLIENTYGGTIVIDMTGTFGTDASDYVMTCKYLSKIIREHRNDNLFVFLYDIDEPGFTYNLITLVKKYMYLVNIREGKGDRKAAKNYLKHLIRQTDFSRFAGQADEFLKTIPQDSYSQTDIIRAFESFEPWCLRKNFLKSYALEADEGFYLDRDTDNLSASEKLEKMIGLKSVKDQIERIILASKVDRQRKKHGGRMMNMIFAGNPGTAKTVVAELMAKIAKEHGVLKSGCFVERAGMSLCGICAPYLVKEAFTSAIGGVLFIDEAYSMTDPDAITALIRQLEAHRNDVIVIFAGYEERMKKFLEQNEGLKSRIPFTIKFPDYKPEELVQIYEYILGQDGYTCTEDAREAAKEIFEKASRIKDFGNGRYARTLAEKSTMNMSVRLARKYDDKPIPESKLYLVTREDVFIPDDPIVNGNDGEIHQVQEPVIQTVTKTAREQLESMIGLESAKKLIAGAVATFKMQKKLRQKGIDIGKNSMHMVFTGNPGTAKTTVARLLAQILKDEGVLSSGVFVEAGRSTLVGKYVGETAIKVSNAFADANGGVLFIDEAYSLNDMSDRGSYGDEAINTIVQEMENRREDIIVIFAGYPDEMNSFIERNPGMSSRIAFRVNFDDYSVEELCEIARFQAASKHMTLTDEAMAKLRPIFETAKESRTFGNGRYVRKAIEMAISNLALRVCALGEEEQTIDVLTTITAEDIVAPELDTTEKPKRRIGFAA